MTTVGWCCGGNRTQYCNVGSDAQYEMPFNPVMMAARHDGATTYAGETSRAGQQLLKTLPMQATIKRNSFARARRAVCVCV